MKRILRYAYLALAGAVSFSVLYLLGIAFLAVAQMVFFVLLGIAAVGVVAFVAYFAHEWHGRI